MAILHEFSNALFSESPNLDLKDQLMLFGQFVGSWDLDWVGYNPDGTTWTVKGEWIFSWALEGRIIQDVWICPSREERKRENMPQGEYGTTLRFYDAGLDAWRVTWIGPLSNCVVTLIARKVDHEIILEDTNKENGIGRWIFSDITGDSFRWRSVTSKDGGTTWNISEEMFVKRRRE